MTLTIDKPPTAGAPPELPPYLRKRRGGEPPRYLIMPFMPFIDRADRLVNMDEGFITVVYRYMVKLDTRTMEGIMATTATRLYRSWLETYEHDIPPHICFGGVGWAAPPDPTMFSRWEKYAKETFC